MLVVLTGWNWSHDCCVLTVGAHKSVFSVTMDIQLSVSMLSMIGFSLGGGGTMALGGGEGTMALGGGEGTMALRGGEGTMALGGGEGTMALRGGEGTMALGGGEGTMALRGGEGTMVLGGGEGTMAVFRSSIAFSSSYKQTSHNCYNVNRVFRKQSALKASVYLCKLMGGVCPCNRFKTRCNAL